MDDLQIIDLFFSRDEQAIAETQRKYGNYCRKIAWNILYDNEDCEECLNDTWLKAWNSIPPQVPGKLGLFLARITRNLAINLHARNTAAKRGGSQMDLCLNEMEEFIGKPSDVQEKIDLSLLKEAINRFLGQLDTDSRKIFVRRYWYFSEIREIARDYGFTDSKVKMSLARTRDKLKSFLKEEGFNV